MIERAWSPTDIERAKFKELEFEGEWLREIGKPEITGSWIIMGPPKNGKTSFAMMVAKYLTNFGRVYYNSIEEGFSKTIQLAFKRVDMSETKGKLILAQENFNQMYTRLSRHKSPDIVIIDSLQFMELEFSEYKKLKVDFANKIFIFISHVDGRKPEGKTAQRIWRDANVIARVEGRRAFIESRFEPDGVGYIDIDAEFANNYWQGQSK